MPREDKVCYHEVTVLSPTKNPHEQRESCLGCFWMRYVKTVATPRFTEEALF